MKLASTAVAVLRCGEVALAVVGGGDIMLPNKKRDIKSSLCHFQLKDNGSRG